MLFEQCRPDYGVQYGSMKGEIGATRNCQPIGNTGAFGLQAEKCPHEGYRRDSYQGQNSTYPNPQPRTRIAYMQIGKWHPERRGHKYEHKYHVEQAETESAANNDFTGHESEERSKADRLWRARTSLQRYRPGIGTSS